MLYFPEVNGKSYAFDWHIGDKIPNLHGVVTMRADGHELEMILRAMENAYVNNQSRTGLIEYNPAIHNREQYSAHLLRERTQSHEDHHQEEDHAQGQVDQEE